MLIKTFPLLEIHFFPRVPLPLVCLFAKTNVGFVKFFFINLIASSLVLLTLSNF